MMLQPCFWYTKDARAAFTLYAEAFEQAEVTLDNGFLFELTLGDSCISGMNGGPGYTPNKTLSVYVELPSVEAVHAAYAALTGEGSTIHMALSQNPWSDAYAWIADAWGVNWQLMYLDGVPPRMSPALLFTGAQVGNAEPAMRHYADVFAAAKTINLARYPETMGADAGLVMYAQQQLNGDDKLVYCDSSGAHAAKFTEGGSLMLLCDTQAEIDRYWKRLTAGGGKAGRCGWCTDKFGLSWQIIPRQLAAWMSNPRTAPKVGQALQGMGKLVIAELEPPAAKRM